MAFFLIEHHDRVMLWINRYHHKLGSRDNCKCYYTDKLSNKSDKKVDEIFIQPHCISLLPTQFYLTTDFIAVQGVCYAHWAQQEFNYMKSLVESHCNELHVDPVDLTDGNEIEHKKIPI